MPKCVDCGTETDRSVMYGPPDELRCPTCVRKLQDREVSNFEPSAPSDPRPYLIIGMTVLAVIATLFHLATTNDPLLGLRFARLVDSFGINAANVDNQLVMYPPAIWDGQVWRLITTAFVHGNLIHLIMNLSFLWWIGPTLEERMGRIWFIGFFLLGTVGSSAAQFVFSGPGVGLSGFAFAAFGLLFALRRYKDFAAQVMQPQVIRSFVVWFFLCIAATYADVVAIANVAHAAGGIIGWLVGRAVLGQRRVLSITGIVLAVWLLTGACVYQPWSWEFCWYQGDEAANRKDYATALSWYRKALSENPSNQDLQNNVRNLENGNNP